MEAVGDNLSFVIISCLNRSLPRSDVRYSHVTSICLCHHKAVFRVRYASMRDPYEFHGGSRKALVRTLNWGPCLVGGLMRADSRRGDCYKL